MAESSRLLPPRRVAEYEVETGPVTLLASVANPVSEGVFGEGDAVAIALPAHLVALVPAS